jgi:hypothetical protein
MSVDEHVGPRTVLGWAVTSKGYYRTVDKETGLEFFGNVLSLAERQRVDIPLLLRHRDISTFLGEVRYIERQPRGGYRFVGAVSSGLADYVDLSQLVPSIAGTGHAHWRTSNPLGGTVDLTGYAITDIALVPKSGMVGNQEVEVSYFDFDGFGSVKVPSHWDALSRGLLRRACAARRPFLPPSELHVVDAPGAVAAPAGPDAIERRAEAYALHGEVVTDKRGRTRHYRENLGYVTSVR